MVKGISQQQRAILNVLPAAGDGSTEGVFGITVAEIAARVGRLSELSADARYLQTQLGKPDRTHMLSRTAHFSVYRAVQALHRRGLVVRGVAAGTRQGRAGRWRRPS